VEIDEARRDHTARRVEDDAPTQTGADRGHPPVLDRDVGGDVEALRRIDDAPAADHHRVLAHALAPGWLGQRLPILSGPRRRGVPS